MIIIIIIIIIIIYCHSTTTGQHIYRTLSIEYDLMCFSRHLSQHHFTYVVGSIAFSKVTQ
jgi:hypothetical protein